MLLGSLDLWFQDGLDFISVNRGKVSLRCSKVIACFGHKMGLLV